MRLTRRASLLRVVWPFAGLVLGLFRKRPAKAADRWPLSLFAVPECALDLGRRVLVQQGESSAGILERWDSEHPILAASWRARDERALKSALPAILKEDFAASRTLIVEGWVLARSEADLFALAAHESRPALT